MSTVEDLAKRIQQMTVSQRLRLAAELVERGRFELAETIAEEAAAALTAHRLFGLKGARRG
jgi:hypothetical protein